MFVKDQNNPIAEQIYGGDLLGNVWRVDVSASIIQGRRRLSCLQRWTDGADPQPITTAPQIEIDIKNGVDRYVFVGTGQLLDQSRPPRPAAANADDVRDPRRYVTTPLPVPPPVTRSRSEGG